MNTMLKSVLVAGTALVSSQAFAQDQVSITSLNFGGTGCTNADAKGQLYDVNLDGLPDQFEILFDKYIAQQGSGVPIVQRRRNCNISVGLHLPQGWQFSIANVRYFGYADLPEGVQGQQRSDYQFINYTGTITLQTILDGPYTDNYERQDNLGIESVVWSPCGLEAPLNIRTQVALSGPSNLPAAMTTDQITGTVSQIYGLTWRRCSP